MHFISFGSDNYYRALSKNILKKLCKKYPCSDTKLYQTKDLPDSLIKYAKNYKRGFGRRSLSP